MIGRSKLVPCLLLAAALVVGAAGCGGGTGETVPEERHAEEQAPPPSGTAIEETQPSDEGASEAETDPGAATSAAADRRIGVEVGLYPPPFTLPDLDGNDVTLAEFEGKVVMLDMWATWCGPCRAEIPFLVSLYEEYRDQGLVVVGVGLDKGGARVLRPFAETNRMSYPVLVGNQSVQSQFKVLSIPTTFIIGRDGRIVSKHVGFHPSMIDGLRSEVVELLGVGGEGA